MRKDERVTAFLDRVEQVRAQAPISDETLYNIVRHRLAEPYLHMLAQRDADAGGQAIGTYQGMKRWLEGYERISSVSSELKQAPDGPSRGTGGAPRRTVPAVAAASALETVPEAHINNMTEEVLGTSALLPSFAGVTQIAMALTEVELDPNDLTFVAQEDPGAFIAILEEGIEACATAHGEVNALAAAQATYNLAVEMTNALTQT